MSDAGAAGRAHCWRNWGIVTLVVQVVAVVGGLPFGATGVAVAVVLTSLLIAVPSISYAEMVSFFKCIAQNSSLTHSTNIRSDNFDEAVHRQK
jgi:hypothetical protein